MLAFWAGGATALAPTTQSLATRGGKKRKPKTSQPGATPRDDEELAMLLSIIAPIL